MESGQRSRLDMARQVAAELLEELETTGAPISQSLMRAKRLARLLRDEDAQAWLNFELSGYPDDFKSSWLGSCRRYAIEGGRITGETHYYTNSLPYIEAEMRADQAAIDAPHSVRSAPLKIDDYLAARATEEVLGGLEKVAEAQRARYCYRSGLYASMRSAIHAYAADASLALELGDEAESIFEAARREVDVFIRSNAPAAAQQLVAISERMREADAESLSSALTSCRRLMAAVADAVFPAQAEDYVDGAGRKRKVGGEDYKNRLLAFVERNIASGGTRSILTADLEHLATRLDAVYEKACKGVHSDVTVEEARLAVIETYIFLGEIARVAPPALSFPAIDATDEAGIGESDAEEIET